MNAKQFIDNLILKEMNNLKEIDSGKVFDVDSAPGVVKRLNSELNAPVVQAKYSTLGGAERVSILVNISLDERETWPNQIFENSRTMLFHIYPQGIIEQPRCSYKIKDKFRRSKFKAEEDLISKINQYLNKVK